MSFFLYNVVIARSQKYGRELSIIALKLVLEISALKAFAYACLLYIRVM